jgi:hypothetical protein
MGAGPTIEYVDQARASLARNCCEYTCFASIACAWPGIPARFRTAWRAHSAAHQTATKVWAGQRRYGERQTRVCPAKTTASAAFTSVRLRRLRVSDQIVVEGRGFFWWRRHMKFVLVNGRRPRPDTWCALCCEPIGESYLRELTTRLSYCSYECYLGHCKLAVSTLTEQARAS